MSGSQPRLRFQPIVTFSRLPCTSPQWVSVKQLENSTAQGFPKRIKGKSQPEKSDRTLERPGRPGFGQAVKAIDDDEARGWHVLLTCVVSTMI